MLQLTESLLRSASSTQSFALGEEYSRSGAIFDTYRQGDVLHGKCQGSAGVTYLIRAELDSQGIRSINCTCSYDRGGAYCEHVVALLLAYVHKPDVFSERSLAEDLLAGMSREALLCLFQNLLTSYPDLYNWLVTAAKTLQSEETHVSLGTMPVTEQPYRRQVKSILHSLEDLSPSRAYWALGDMITELDNFAQSIRQSLDSGDPLITIAALMAILEEVSDQYEMFDDTSGELAGFLDDLGIPLAEAILTAGSDLDHLQDLANRLADLYRQLSAYGIYGVGVALAAVRFGWQSPILPGKADEKSEVKRKIGIPENPELEEYLHDLNEARLNVLERQGRIDDYLELCQKSNNPLRLCLKLVDLGRTDEALYAAQTLNNAEQAFVVAEHLFAHQQTDSAIEVAERGLSLFGQKFELGSWLGPIEEAINRPEQAQRAYQAAFDEAPSLDQYKALERLAEPDWASLKPRLIEQLSKASHSEALVDVFLEEQEWDLAITIADQQADWNYRLVDQVVEAVTPFRPDWAIKACRGQAEQLIEKKQSQYYTIAGRWLTKMKYAYTIQGRQAEWEEYLAGLRNIYSRRPALQSVLKYL